MGGEALDLVDEFGGGDVVAEFFGVAGPEFDLVVGEDFDEAAGVVVLELGEPA